MPKPKTCQSCRKPLGLWSKLCDACHRRQAKRRGVGVWRPGRRGRPPESVRKARRAKPSRSRAAAAAR